MGDMYGGVDHNVPKKQFQALLWIVGKIRDRYGGELCRQWAVAVAETSTNNQVSIRPR
jgi:hypothetical protein